MIHDDEEILLTRLSRAFGLRRLRFRGDDLIDESYLASNVHDLDDLTVRGALVSLDDNHRGVVQQLSLRLQFFFEGCKRH